MITYQLEPWDSYYRDPARERLWREHYAELEPAHEGKMEMSPDVAAYRAFEAAGMLMVMVAREAGVMVGYCLIVCKPHIHYSRELCGFEDSYFLTKPARRGMAGYRLLVRSQKAALARGCRRVYWMTKQFASIELLLKRMGGVEMDKVFCVKGAG